MDPLPPPPPNLPVSNPVNATDPIPNETKQRLEEVNTLALAVIRYVRESQSQSHQGQGP